MALPQQKFREIVFQLLYSEEMAQAADEDMIPFMMQQLAVAKSAMRQAHERLRAIVAKKGEIDALIAATSKEYEESRITRVEKNILRLAIFELRYDQEIPPKVAISEAIRLARKFGTPEGGAFVNAILDEICKSSSAINCSASSPPSASAALPATSPQ